MTPRLPEPCDQCGRHVQDLRPARDDAPLYAEIPLTALTDAYRDVLRRAAQREKSP